MSEVFLDTSFIVAVTIPSDRHHATAVRFARQYRKDGTQLVTTQAVLAEIGDAFSRPPYRSAAVRMLSMLLLDESVTVLPFAPSSSIEATRCLFSGKTRRGA